MEYRWGGLKKVEGDGQAVVCERGMFRKLLSLGRVTDQLMRQIPMDGTKFDLAPMRSRMVDIDVMLRRMAVRADDGS